MPGDNDERSSAATAFTLECGLYVAALVYFFELLDKIHKNQTGTEILFSDLLNIRPGIPDVPSDFNNILTSKSHRQQNRILWFQSR